MVDVGTVAFQFPIWTFRLRFVDIGLYYIRIGRGDGVENGFVDAKILGEDGLGRVLDPVINGKGCSLVAVNVEAKCTKVVGIYPVASKFPGEGQKLRGDPLIPENTPSSNANKYSLSSSRPKEILLASGFSCSYVHCLP